MEFNTGDFKGIFNVDRFHSKLPALFAAGPDF
jgi:hypothetical protein